MRDNDPRLEQAAAMRRENPGRAIASIASEMHIDRCRVREHFVEIGLLEPRKYQDKDGKDYASEDDWAMVMLDRLLDVYGARWPSDDAVAEAAA